MWLWVLSSREPQGWVQDLLWSSGGGAAGLDPGEAISREPVSMGGTGLAAHAGCEGLMGRSRARP